MRTNARPLVSSPRAHRAVPFLIAALGAVTFSPALRCPRFLDDYLHTLMIDGRFPVARSPFNLYDFVGEPERAAFMERGLLPWWTHPELKLRFLRPVSSALLWFEQRVLNLGVGMQHLHSFLWWFVCVLSARALFRRLLGERAALLATLVFAFAPCHAMPLSWIANRNALLSLAFGTMALRVYLDLCAQPRVAAGLSACALFTLALLSGEYALCFGGYVMALELVRRGDGLRRRALRLSAFFVPALAYLLVRYSLGYGTAGSGFYVDPLAEPWAFLRIAPFRLASLLGQGWFTLGTDTWLLRSASTQWLVFPCVGALGLVIGLILRRVYSTVTPALRSHLGWLLIGSVLALIPVLSTVPSPRLMGIALLGIAPHIALILERAWFPDASVARSPAFERLGVMAAVLGFMHFVHGPVVGWLAASQIERDASRFVADVSWVEKRLHELHSSEVVVLRGGVDSFFGPFAMVVGGGHWTRWDVLSDPMHLLTLRRDASTLDLIVPDDSTLCPSGGFSLFRGTGLPLRPGEERRGARFDLRVLSVGKLGPTRARVTFDATIGKKQLWVSRQGERLHETPPPRIGYGLPSER
jgi:hypothetical protein